MSGGDRYERVDEQVNFLLQQLLVMDVDHDGRLSYDEWTRGVLALPEVLACFQLASTFAQPSPAAKRAEWAERGMLSRQQQQQQAGHGGAAVVQIGWQHESAAQRPSSLPVVVRVSSVTESALWWKTMWRSVIERVACTMCATQHA